MLGLDIPQIKSSKDLVTQSTRNLDAGKVIVQSRISYDNEWIKLSGSLIEIRRLLMKIIVSCIANDKKLCVSQYI